MRLLPLDVHPSLVPGSAMTFRKLALGLCVAERFMQHTWATRCVRAWWAGCVGGVLSAARASPRSRSAS